MKIYVIKDWSINETYYIGCDDYSQGTCRKYSKYSIYKDNKEYHRKHTTSLIENVCEEHLQYLGEDAVENTRRSIKKWLNY